MPQKKIKTKIMLPFTDSDFNTYFNDTIHHIEQTLDAFEVFFDYEISSSVLTIEINKNFLIINKQTPTQEIWLATPEKGLHFSYQKNKWFCKKYNLEFFSTLSFEIEKYSNQKIDFNR